MINAFMLLRVAVRRSHQLRGYHDTVAPWAKQIFRWESLLPADGEGSPSSALVEHIAWDEQRCTCPRPSCAGKLPSQAAASYLIVAVLRIALSLAVFPALLWTPLITLGHSVWSTWWGAIVGALLCACATVSALPIAFRQAMFPIQRMTELSLGIQRRAAVIVVGELVRTAREQPDSLARVAHDAPAAQVYVSLPLQLLGLALNAAVGGCFTTWQFLIIFATVQISFAFRLGIAAANARVAAVTEVYDSGRTALLQLLVQWPDMPPAAATAIRDHAALLGCLAAEAPLAKWLGFTVTWGLVRTLAVTALTAFGALWGIVRGLGVTVTIESVCGVEKLI
ncbi:hypothetical protein DFJ74DRAFT_724858 [Hyaloraphidium curvatum]|nr:hypothetical protein DFJ74DRAFT_724858 [Hyaloraphidium curvatum]